MRLLISLAILFATLLSSAAKEEELVTDIHLERVLLDYDRTLKHIEDYTRDKEQRISELKSNIGRSNDFVIYHQLFGEYRYYQYDSAYYYARRLEEIATRTGKPNEKALAQSALLFCFKSVGFFSEAVEVMEAFSPEGLPRQICAQFYVLCAQTYQNLSSYVRTAPDLARKYDALKQHYYKIAKTYAEEYTFLYDDIDLTIKLNEQYSDSLAVEARRDHIAQYRYSIDEHELGVQYAILAMAQDALGRRDEAIYYRALSAICDLHTCTRETTSSKTLAEYMYERKQLPRAHLYVKQALSEANSYNTSLRKVEINAILPQIENSRYNWANRQRVLYLSFGSAVLLLLILAFILSIRLRRSNLELSRTHKQLLANSDQLAQSNLSLNEANSKLKEVNEIKDSYIIQSLYVNPDFVNYIERQSKAIIAKIGAKQYDDARSMLHKLNIKGERERIYSSFDQAFLKLFPNFITAFNSLFPESERISLDENGAMPMDVRIFALMRLGIDNPQQVGDYLNLSVNTVYVYKANIKAKSLVPKEEFDERILAIPKP